MSTHAYVHPGKVEYWRPLRIEWNDCPDEVRSAVESLLKASLFALPQWVSELNVFWDERGESESGPAALTVAVRNEYRFVSMFVHPGFLAYDSDARLRLVLHEFSHALTRSLDALLETLIDGLGDEAFRDFAREQLRRAKETTTQDITEAFLRARMPDEVAGD